MDNTRYSAKDIKEGNIPAFTGVAEFKNIFPINRVKLLKLCNRPGAPVMRNGKKFVIKTAEMIRFIENEFTKGKE